MDIARYSEVRQKDAMLGLVVGMGHHDVGRLDISVKEALFVGVVQRAGDRRDDADNVLNRHSSGVTAGQEAAQIQAVNEVHRHPQLAVVFATIVHAHDVRVPEGSRQFSFPEEAGAVVGIGRHIRREHLQCIFTRQSRVLRQVNLAHPPRAQQADDRVTGKDLTML
ncbi:hypothetical protein A5711_06885 [Mycobacterium sp. E2238]|nr:hypothetical protein A5711_06885 [Mycobacterium sp. E2238]